MARPPRQVIAHHIDNYGRKHRNYTDPETPITMRPFPVRTMAIMNTVVILTSVPVVIVLLLIHLGLPHFQFRISGMSIPCLSIY